MYADSKESAYGSTFLVSPPNSIYGRVYTKNMDETSFIGYDFENGLQRVLDNPKTAYFGNCITVYRQHQYKSCQVLQNVEFWYLAKNVRNIFF